MSLFLHTGSSTIYSYQPGSLLCSSRGAFRILAQYLLIHCPSFSGPLGMGWVHVGSFSRNQSVCAFVTFIDGDCQGDCHVGLQKSGELAGPA